MIFIRMILAAFLLSGCQVEQQVTNNKSRQAPADKPKDQGPGSADQTPQAAWSDRGCNEPTVRSWTLRDTAGGEQPICTLLSESSARAVVLLPVDYTCAACLDQVTAVRSALTSLNGVTVALVAPSGTSHPDALDLLAAEADHKVLLYIDHDGQFAARLKERGVSWSEPVSYAFNVTDGAYLRTDAAAYQDTLVSRFKLTESGPQNPFVWDGLANQGHGGWIIE